ncbi:hypothetical protein [Roseomonas sp. CECT 9278]|uniref:hypothetical protein n=1 Tax=Roseomonas sp. CECT 9278 TaxID=2845823 RepID=UPI001E55490C|nr:hypothetical protein [Roseomonas sp. CECT 9278]CAH0270766.1 hypothetical protein ROS9278_03658 [Roseomonas sp. CECT 9278]
MNRHDGPAPATALVHDRLRQRSLCLRRVEVQVRQEDTPPLRAVAAALADAAQAETARADLRRRFASAAGLKALLAAVSLDGLDLERPRDTGRDSDL